MALTVNKQISRINFKPWHSYQKSDLLWLNVAAEKMKQMWLLDLKSHGEAFNAAAPSSLQVIEFDDGSGSVLRIQPLRTHRDEAIYECTATNSVGEINTSAKLTVLEGES